MTGYRTGGKLLSFLLIVTAMATHQASAQSGGYPYGTGYYPQHVAHGHGWRAPAPGYYPQPHYPQQYYPQPHYPQPHYPQPHYPQPHYPQPRPGTVLPPVKPKPPEPKKDDKEDKDKKPDQGGNGNQGDQNNGQQNGGDNGQQPPMPQPPQNDMGQTPPLGPMNGGMPMGGGAGPTSDLASSGPTSAPDLFGDIFTTNRTPFVVNNATVGGVALFVPNPATGGNAGRVKIAEGNSVLPRHRIFGIADYFDSVQLQGPGSDFDVYRAAPGIELAFWGGTTSFEVRVPFASTLSGTQQVTGPNRDRDFELGNVHLTVKHLICSSKHINISTGLGISLPTADDVEVRIGATQFLRIRNESVILTPFLAALLTPNDRMFAQAWVAVGVDTSGNTVDANTVLQGVGPVGILNDPALLQVDGQFGVWLHKDCFQQSFCRALAAFVEVHYNGNLENGDQILSPNGFSLGRAGDRIDELNVSAGFFAKFGDCATVSIGATVPVRDGNAQDRFFDLQLGARVNFLFGPNYHCGGCGCY